MEDAHPAGTPPARPRPAGAAAMASLVAGQRGEHAGQHARTAWWGYGDADARHVVVALHGLRGTHHGLLPVVGQAPGVRFVLPDLPGFGESEPLRTGAHDVEGYVRWARDFVAAVAPGAAVLGHSFGSIVAAALAATSAVPALVLVNPIAARLPSEGSRGADAVAGAFHRLAGALPERAGTALLRSRAVTDGVTASLLRTHDGEVRSWVRAEHRRYFSTFASRAVVLEAFGAAVSEHVDTRAGAVGAPVLLVAGESDVIAPLAAQRRLVARFPRAELVVVPGTGHLAHYETPGQVADAVLGFLRRSLP